MINENFHCDKRMINENFHRAEKAESLYEAAEFALYSSRNVCGLVPERAAILPCSLNKVAVMRDINTNKTESYLNNQ